MLHRLGVHFHLCLIRNLRKPCGELRQLSPLFLEIGRQLLELSIAILVQNGRFFLGIQEIAVSFFKRLLVFLNFFARIQLPCALLFYFELIQTFSQNGHFSLKLLKLSLCLPFFSVKSLPSRSVLQAFFLLLFPLPLYLCVLIFLFFQFF